MTSSPDVRGDKPKFSGALLAFALALADSKYFKESPGICGPVVMGWCRSPESRNMITKHPLISIVEDDEFFRESMRRMTSSLGYSVETFPSPAAFLASPQRAETDCLVTDVQMPGMTGLELHRHIVDAGYPIPTIIMTAYPDEAVRSRALKNGVICYLSKPVDDDCFERCLRLALKLDSRPEEIS